MIDKELFEKGVEYFGMSFGSEEEKEWVRRTYGCTSWERGIKETSCSIYSCHLSNKNGEDVWPANGLFWELEWIRDPYFPTRWKICLYDFNWRYSDVSKVLDIKKTFCRPGNIKSTMLEMLKSVIEWYTCNIEEYKEAVAKLNDKEEA